MKIKSDVIMAGLKLPMREALIEAEKLWIKYGREEGVTVTSALDGTHTASSLHYYGYALDLRTRYFDREQCHKLSSDLQNALRLRGFVVVLHSTHIHVEYRRIID